MVIILLAMAVIRLFGRLLRAAWTDPVDPISNTVITVAYAVANFLTQIRWLRTLTGGADPGGTGYIVTSDSVSSTSWKTGVGAITAVQGFQSVNRTGDTGMTGNFTTTGIVQAAGFQAGASGVNGGGGGINASTGGYAGGLTTVGTPSVLGIVIGASGASIGAGGISTTGPYSSSGAGGTITASGAIASLAGLSGSSGTFSGTVNITQATGIAPLIIASTTKVTNLHVDILDGAHASSTPTANTIPIADGSGHLDAWITASAGVMPSLMGAWWSSTVASIPSGWSRATGLDGRIPVGAGTGTTDYATGFTEGGAYGSSWSHTHTQTAHSHGASALGISGVTGGPSALNGLGNNGGTNVPSTTHTHDAGTLDVTGSTDSATPTINGLTVGTTWAVPLFAVVWVTKN